MLLYGKPRRKSVHLIWGDRTRFYDLVVRHLFKDNEIIGIACTSKDITESELAEEQLDVLKKEKNG